MYRIVKYPIQNFNVGVKQQLNKFENVPILESNKHFSFQGIPLPTLQDLENKIEAIDKCKHYVYSNKDISKIVEEKRRFRKVPINYAMTKNELMKELV